MMDKIICIKPKQALDQSLISIGGWLRSIDAQIISFIRPGSISWTKQDFSLYQRRKVPAYQSGSLALNYAYAPPIRQRMEMSAVPTVKLRQLPALQLSEGLSQFWSTSYQFSTALAVLLPIAVNVAQSPIVLNFVAQASRAVEAQTLSASTAPPKTAPAAMLTAKSSVQMPRPFSKPTGKIANIQSYVLPAKGEFTSGYGMRWGRLHRGIDIAGPIGTPILAAGAGQVITAGWSEDGFGNKVEIKHPDGTVTLYAHTSQVLTRVGAQVQQGEQIAKMGSSGFSTGPHLHFQVHPRGKTAVDPMFFFGNQRTLMAANPNP